MQHMWHRLTVIVICLIDWIKLWFDRRRKLILRFFSFLSKNLSFVECSPLIGGEMSSLIGSNGWVRVSQLHSQRRNALNRSKRPWKFVFFSSRRFLIFRCSPVTVVVYESYLVWILVNLEKNDYTFTVLANIVRKTPESSFIIVPINGNFILDLIIRINESNQGIFHFWYFCNFYLTCKKMY